MKDLNQQLRLLSYNLNDCEEIIEVIDSTNGQGLKISKKEELIQQGVPSDYVNNYDTFFGFMIQWQSMPQTGIQAQGAIKVLELPIIFSDWKGQTYFENTPADSTLRDFKPIDMRDEFCDHAAGIYFGKNKTDFTFHFGELDGSELLSLDLDINGYIEMMIIAKGCYGWQWAILNLIDESLGLHENNFRENMPKLFPDWTWEGFVHKFEEVRLNKVK